MPKFVQHIFECINTKC